MTLLEVHTECRRIIEVELFEGDFSNRSLCCRMYDTMIEDDDCENSIGENFNQRLIRLVENWFDKYKPGTDIDYYFENYCLSLYLFFERIEFVFNVINKDQKNKLFNDFYYYNFNVMTKIAKWANFIKHPKEFLFTHWPTFYFEGDSLDKQPDDLTVDTDFIFTHYKSEKKQSPTILENNAKVYIELPDLIALTKGFCEELNTFIDFICENQIVYKYLEKKSTIEDYYKSETED